ncbi:MAG: hypothetical protein V3T83_11285 [Acidobacteriota bacterium]
MFAGRDFHEGRGTFAHAKLEPDALWRPGFQHDTVGRPQVIAHALLSDSEVFRLLEVQAGKFSRPEWGEADPKDVAPLPVEPFGVIGAAVGRLWIVQAGGIHLESFEGTEEPGGKAVIEARVGILVDVEVSPVGLDTVDDCIQETSGEALGQSLSAVVARIGVRAGGRQAGDSSDLQYLTGIGLKGAAVRFRLANDLSRNGLAA